MRVNTYARSSAPHLKVSSGRSLGAHDAGRKPTRILPTASRMASPSDVEPLGPLFPARPLGPAALRGRI